MIADVRFSRQETLGSHMVTTKIPELLGMSTTYDQCVSRNFWKNMGTFGRSLVMDFQKSKIKA